REGDGLVAEGPDAGRAVLVLDLDRAPAEDLVVPLGHLTVLARRAVHPVGRGGEGARLVQRPHVPLDLVPLRPGELGDHDPVTGNHGSYLELPSPLQVPEGVDRADADLELVAVPVPVEE